MKHMLARYMHHPVDRNNIHFLYVSAHTTFQEMMKQFRKNRYHMIQINRQSVLTEDDYLQLLFSRQPRYSMLGEDIHANPILSNKNG